MIAVSGTGQVNAENQVDLTPQVAGDGLDVTQVSVKNDQKVKKGDLIAVLDTTDIQKTIRDAKLAIESAEIKVKQSERQFDTKTVDDKYERQLQKNTLKQNQNALSNAYDDLAEYSITAPFDGIVTGLDVSVGDSISREDILASVITEEVKTTISLNEVDAAKVKEGNGVLLTFDALDGQTASGSVTKIDTIGVVDQGVVTYDVDISFVSPSELLKPGMSVTAEIEIEKAINVLMVPAEAILSEKNDRLYVLVEAKNNMGEVTQERKEIQKGISDDAVTEVIDGVSEGDVVIIQSKVTSTASANQSSGGSSLLPIGSGAGRPRD